MIRIGARVPEIEMRTDEGTPISLCDMEGRGMVVFLLGEISDESERVLSLISENSGRFLSIDFSPVAVMAEPVNRLAEYRERTALPYLMLSDPGSFLHRGSRDPDGLGIGAWIVDEAGVVVETVPTLPADDLVSLAFKKAGRSSRGPGHSNFGE